MAQKIASPWPEGCQGAISLSFDDARPSQPEIAIPMLKYVCQPQSTGSFWLFSMEVVVLCAVISNLLFKSYLGEPQIPPRPEVPRAVKMSC